MYLSYFRKVRLPTTLFLAGPMHGRVLAGFYGELRVNYGGEAWHTFFQRSPQSIKDMDQLIARKIPPPQSICFPNSS